MASVRPAGKYEPLQRVLEGAAAGELTLSFAELEALIGGAVPVGASAPTWWANAARTFQGRAWRNAGWRVQHADVYLQTVTFVRVVADG
jgi:hypothetical protein